MSVLNLERPVDKRLFGERAVVKLGEIAIDPERLGIRDPIAHLYRRLAIGESSLAYIKEDLKTDIGERLNQASFLNQAEFCYKNNDFISQIGEMSMREMTAINLEIISEEALNNPILKKQQIRAELEANEVDILSGWFDQAKIGNQIVFESLPIDEESFTMARIYQKTSESDLTGNFISLYNSDIETFNQLRYQFGDFSSFDKPEDFLANPYQILSEKSVEDYVDQYDSILNSKDGQKYKFGLPIEKRRDAMKLVAEQESYLEPYLEMINLLGESDGRVSHGIKELWENLDLQDEVIAIELDQIITTDLARQMLKEIVISIASTIDKEIKTDDIYQAVSDGGSSARELGQDYKGGFCPEIGRTEISGQISNENQSGSVFSLFAQLENFGKVSYKRCRVKGCPNRCKTTKVGGCGLCVRCHLLASAGKNPEKYYKEQKAKQEETANRLAKEKQYRERQVRKTEANIDKSKNKKSSSKVKTNS